MLMGKERPPKDLLVSKEWLKKMVANPKGFVLAVALAPHKKFSREDVMKFEAHSNWQEGECLERHKKGGMVLWTIEKPLTLWASGKVVEGITSDKDAYIMGGHSHLWPIPLQRQGPLSNKVWKVVLPGEPTKEWMEGLAKDLDNCFKGVFWTLSNRCVGLI